MTTASMKSYPALNDVSWVSEADYLTAGLGGTEVLNVVTDDGHHWQVTIAKDPIRATRLRIGDNDA